MLEQVGLATFFIILIFILHRWQVYPMVLLTLQESIGIISLAYITSAYTWQLHTLNVVILVAGYSFTYLIIKSIKRKEGVGDPNFELAGRPVTDYEVTRLWILSLVIIALVIYHFAIAGIPMLSSDVEMTRFNFSSSGLFGLPGRMYLFGLPLLTMYISIYHLKNSINPDKTKLIYKIVWGAYILSRLLAGFKSAIIEALFMTIYVKAAIGRPPSFAKMSTIFRYIIMFGLAVVFALLIALQYGSLGLNNTSDGLSYLIDRTTVISMRPQAYLFDLVNQSEGMPYGGYFNYYINDGQYFMQKYFHIGMSSETIFPLQQQVSAAIYGTSLTLDSFIVPVTIGAFPEAGINLGLIGACIAMFVFGSVYAWLILRAQTSGRILAVAIYAYSALTVDAFITKGSLMYNIINTGAVFLIFLAFNQIAKVLTQILLGSSSGSRSISAQTDP